MEMSPLISVSCKSQKHRRIKDSREFYGIIDAEEMEINMKKTLHIREG